MRKNIKINITIISLIFISTVYGVEKNKNVLFISSYNQNFVTVPEQIKGIQSVFKANKINLDIEYMDTKRFDTKENKDNFYQYLKYKLENLEPYDAIIVGDDSALQFAMDYKDDIFKNLPIVFMGINDFKRAESAFANDNMTGIIEQTSLKENIEMAKKINKNAKRVVAIVDNTFTGVGDKEQFYLAQKYFNDLKFEDITVSEYTFMEVENILENIENDTILLYLSMLIDKTGRTISIDKAVDIVCEHTHVPIYGVSVIGIGKGILGGKMVDFFKLGEMAADMVLDILNGTPVETIEMVYDTPHNYVFDYNIIRKYNIDENLIPNDAILINRKINPFEENKEIFLTIIQIMAFMIIILTVLIIDNINRRAIEKALTESNRKLSETYEELAVSEEELRVQYDTIQENIYEMKKLNDRYELAIESTNSAVWEINLDNNELYISKNFASIMNITTLEFKDVNKLLNRVLNGYYRELLLKEYLNYKNGVKDEINIQIPIKIYQDTIKWILVNGKGFFDSNNNFSILHGIILDITEIKEQKDHIEFLAHHDYLTSLPNRMQFIEKLSEAIEDGNLGAVLLLDIDNFKDINDNLGHAYGDKILKKISNRFRSLVDENFFVSRFGGDEFLILITNVEKIYKIEEYVNKIIYLFEESYNIDNIDNYIQFSMGITRFPHDGDDINQLIANADTAMYKAKHLGKNNYKLFTNEMKYELTNRSEIEYILRDALKNDGFIMLYQPQVSVATGEIIGFEALIRLKEHKISPSIFITIAEENGLILDIGRWVTKAVIEQLVCWRDRGFVLKPVSINFSSKQLRDANYVEFLNETLIENCIEAKYLEIEITEGILLEKTENTIEFLNKLKDMGIKISLDDFGTGFSSLNYLTYIPVNKIKLDKSLCDKFLELNNINVIGSIISLAHSLNLEITAEGIEKLEQYQRLKSVGCDYIQGYLFSKSLNVVEIEKIYYNNLLEDNVDM